MERSWDGVTKSDEPDGPNLLSENKVDVELLPEKKGLVIKHVEYLVKSAKHQSEVNFSTFWSSYFLLFSIIIGLIYSISF